MGVSKNRGTPKWMVYSGKPINMDDLGIHYFRKHPYKGKYTIHGCYGYEDPMISLTRSQVGQ